MGQYFKVINTTKKEYLDPHKCGDGAKLMEMACSSGSTMAALATLLATSNGQGGGDLGTDDKTWVGRWAGDSIAMVGDYDTFSPHAGLYEKCGNSEDWKDVSFDVMRVLMEDTYLAERMAENTYQIERWKRDGQKIPLAVVKAMTQQKKAAKKDKQPA